MVSLPYAEVSGRAARARPSRPGRPADTRTLNWRFLAALAFNLVAWAGLIKLIAHFV